MSSLRVSDPAAPAAAGADGLGVPVRHVRHALALAGPDGGHHRAGPAACVPGSPGRHSRKRSTAAASTRRPRRATPAPRSPRPVARRMGSLLGAQIPPLSPVPSTPTKRRRRKAAPTAPPSSPTAAAAGTCPWSRDPFECVAALPPDSTPDAILAEWTKNGIRDSCATPASAVAWLGLATLVQRADAAARPKQ